MYGGIYVIDDTIDTTVYDAKRGISGSLACVVHHLRIHNTSQSHANNQLECMLPGLGKEMLEYNYKV